MLCKVIPWWYTRQQLCDSKFNTAESKGALLHFVVVSRSHFFFQLLCWDDFEGIRNCSMKRNPFWEEPLPRRCAKSHYYLLRLKPGFNLHIVAKVFWDKVVRGMQHRELCFFSQHASVSCCLFFRSYCSGLLMENKRQAAFCAEMSDRLSDMFRNVGTAGAEALVCLSKLGMDVAFISLI